MNKEEILKLIKEQITKAQTKAQYSFSRVPFHVHNNIDAPNIPWSSLISAPNNFCIAVNTNGTTNVDVFGSGGSPYDLVITGVFLIAKDATAGSITVLQGTNTVCTIAKGTVAGVMVGATSLLNTRYSKKDAFQVDSSSTGNATVFITYEVI